VVDITLTTEEGEARPGKEIVITVKDRGRGIQEADKDALFELNMRGDGLIETGNGLGLYCARKSASLQGGDVILVSSSPDQGSVFKISLPYAMPGEAVQETEEVLPPRTRTALRWGLAIAGLLLAAVLLFLLFKPPQRVVLLSAHKRYVTALGEDGGWLLKQEEELGECGEFYLIHLINGKVALLTCHGRYVTAPRRGIERSDWVLWQDSGLGDCGQFTVHDQGSTGVAFETCVGNFFTAGNDTWSGLEWLVVAETKEIKDWERFTLEPQR
jgi:hypothetical protein